MYNINPKTKITTDDLIKIKYMANDNWGDIFKMSSFLVFTIEAMRFLAKNPIVLTSPAYTGRGHSKNSLHYIGQAADIRVLGMSLMDMFILASRFPFTGIGIYPHADHPFLHVEIDELIPFENRGLWIGIKSKCPEKLARGEWDYVTFNEENLKELVYEKNIFCVD